MLRKRVHALRSLGRKVGSKGGQGSGILHAHIGGMGAGPGVAPFAGYPSHRE